MFLAWLRLPGQRHPLLAALLGVLGILLAVALFVFSLVVASALLLAGASIFAAMRLLGRRRRGPLDRGATARPASPETIEGEFRVVDGQGRGEPRARLPHDDLPS